VAHAIPPLDCVGDISALNLGRNEIGIFTEVAPSLWMTLVRVPFTDINKHLEMLRDGDIVGRVVVTFDEAASPRKKEEIAA
jgi:hypothetical protein